MIVTTVIYNIRFLSVMQEFRKKSL